MGEQIKFQLFSCYFSVCIKRPSTAKWINAQNMTLGPVTYNLFPFAKLVHLHRNFKLAGILDINTIASGSHSSTEKVWFLIHAHILQQSMLISLQGDQ